MSQYISDSQRLLVAKRANYKCEYCLIAQADTYHTCHIDHIISIKHGGITENQNLAFACQFCNRNKGSDVGSYLFDTENFVRFYNPRKDKWPDHFYIENGFILAKTKIAEATIKILNFNDPEVVIDRRLLIQTGRYSVPGPE